MEKEIIGKSPLLLRLEKIAKYTLFWLKWFFPKAKGISPLYMIIPFITQKILRINGGTPWPVHFTTRVLYAKKIEIGNRSTPGSNSGCYIQGRCGIKIGHNLRLGPGCGLISANHDADDYDTWVKSEPLEIGDNVWIGMNTVIMPGVKIGDNVIIGSNSVVNKDIPSNSIAAGIPCKVLKEKEPYKGKDYSTL